MAAFSIRPASPEDYQGVLVVSEGIYDGYDYLPFVFHRWLQDPNRELFVAHLGSKLVGFVSVASIDDGATCYMGTLRIHPSYRRRGLGVRLASDALQRFKLNRGTSFKRERYLTRAGNIASLALMKKIDPSRELHQRWQQYSVRFPVSKEAIRLDSRLVCTAMESTRSCSKQEWLKALIVGQSKQWVHELFPKGLAMVGLRPFDIMIFSNWDGVFENGSHVFLDQEGDPQQDHGIKGISFGVSSQRVRGMTWFMAIRSTNPYSLKAHLGRQLQLAHEHLQEEDFELFLLCDERFASEAKSFFLDEMKLKECRSSFSFLVLERTYQPLPKEPEVV